jgi:hypothetical protein
MIRCGRSRWDAKEKICDWDEKKKEVACQMKVEEPAQNQIVKVQAPVLTHTQADEKSLKKTEADAALERLLAERKKLDNYWNQ